MIKNDIAILSRDFLKKYNIIRYRMKKISEMNDQEVITACHWYCEENNLISEWNDFGKRAANNETQNNTKKARRF